MASKMRKVVITKKTKINSIQTNGFSLSISTISLFSVFVVFVSLSFYYIFVGPSNNKLKSHPTTQLDLTPSEPSVIRTRPLASVPFVPCECAWPQGNTKSESADLGCAVLDDNTNTGSTSLATKQMDVEGLRTIRGYLSEDEQNAIVDELMKYEFKPYVGKSCQEFGQNFSFYIDQPTSNYLPPNVQATAERLIKDGILKDHETPNYVLINQYTPGQGIHPHIDDDYYTDGIISVTLLSGAAIEFKRDRQNSFYKDNPLLEEKYKNNDLLECGSGYFEPGSLFALHGESRYAYKHEIKRRERDRAVYARRTNEGDLKVHHVRNIRRKMRMAVTFRRIKDEVIKTKQSG